MSTTVIAYFSGLCEAAYQLAAAVHEEKPKAGTGSDEVPAPFAFNLDEMSDDDDEGKNVFLLLFAPKSLVP